ncbi:MAG: LemA family protein [Leptospirillia bacterium]
MGQTANMWLAIAAFIIVPGILFLHGAGEIFRYARSRDRLWEQIIHALKVRHSLAPKLVAIASLYIPWNDPLIKDVTTARLRAMSAVGVAHQAACEAELSWALARMMVAAEASDEIAHHADFATYAEELEEVENQVARLRIDYNRQTTLLSESFSHFWSGIAGRMGNTATSEPFDLDPLLARQAMMSTLVIHPPGGPHPENGIAA